MAKSIDARLTHIEEQLRQRALWRVYQAEAAALGMDPHDLKRECEDFLSMPLHQQLEEIDELARQCAAEGMDWPEVEAIKATLRREYRPR
jgi:hypothetical protein